MFKIGEFSKLTQVSIRMLRHYHETGLLVPAEIDTESGYRLYTADQIPTLNRIIFLRDLGFGILEIADSLNNWNDQYIANILNDKQAQILQKIEAEKETLKKIELAKEDIYTEQIELHYNVTIKSVPSYPVLSIRRRIPDYFAEGLLWKELYAFSSAIGVEIIHNTFSIYHDQDYRENHVDVELCIPVKELGLLSDAPTGISYRNTEAIPYMASSMVYGPFENIAGTYRSFARWLQNHNQYKMCGESRQIVHRGPWNEEDSADYLTEMQIPLKKITSI